jgi:hypothetical protein
MTYMGVKLGLTLREKVDKGLLRMECWREERGRNKIKKENAQ